MFWNIESYNRRAAIKGLRTPTLTFSRPSPSLVLWLSIQTLVHARVAFSLGRCIIRITPIWSKLTKSLHPFTGQAMGDISGIAILFRRAINYILSGDQIYEGTCERLWKSQLAVGFDRDVSFGEIFGCLRICITSISCPLPQLVSWSV